MILTDIASRRRMAGFLPRKYVLATLFMMFCVCNGHSQSNAAKPTTSTQSGSSGFSIETEMLTYRALESNSEAIACDIAAVITGTRPDFNHPADGTACAPPASAAQTTILLLPFEKSELQDFAEWRTAMAQMADLQSKASSLGCPRSSEKAGKAPAQVSTSSLASFLSMSPAGPPLTLAEKALGLFASTESATSVGGNIKDLAFMNDVARHLKTLHMAVLMPSSYDPGTLTMSDEKISPFLASKKRTLLAKGCLSTLKPDEHRSAADIKQAISDIDNYMDTFSGSKPAKTTNDKSTPNDASADGTSTNQPGRPTPNTPSSLSAVLRADGLAQKLGFSFDSETGQLSPPAAGYYILMVKALESGGSVTGRSNILGTKLRYSGGAVGTYALFAAEGDLVCSGNVYDYGGSLSAKHFERDLRKLHFDPAQQVIFHAGTCPTLNAVAPRSNPVK